MAVAGSVRPLLHDCKVTKKFVAVTPDFPSSILFKRDVHLLKEIIKITRAPKKETFHDIVPQAKTSDRVTQ